MFPVGQSLTMPSPDVNLMQPGSMPTTAQMAAQPVSRYVNPATGAFTPEGMQRARDVTDTAMAMGGVGPFGGRGVSVLPDGTISAGGNSVGRVKYNHGDQMTRIADIQVDPSYQNQGIGTAAIKQIQDEAAARGNPVVLSTDAFRGKQAQADQLRLYQRLGFSPNTGPDAVSERIGGKKVAEQLVWRPPEATPSPEATPDVAPPPSFTAYHGSPHAFDQFDLSKIGTGEGAQAYGHGAYLADAEGVAESYRDQLTPKVPYSQTVSIGGKPLAEIPEFQALNKRAQANVAAALTKGTSKEDWLGHVQSSLDDTGNGNWSHDMIAQRRALYQPGMDFVKTVDPAQVNVAPQPTGHMYEVQVNADPAHFLDWDKSMSEQPDIWSKFAETHPELATQLQNKYAGNFNKEGGMPGYEFHTFLSHELGGGDVRAGHAPASQALQEAGIPGIRYLDAGSRGAGEGSRNSVVFDANTMDIIRRYGLAGLMAGGGAAAGMQQTGGETAQ
jgi:GNAT superfamily N-acetyltransferase